MVNLTEGEFLKCKEREKNFSLISTFRGDDLTPINIYKGLEGENKFIFESGSRNEHFGRYSFIGEKAKYLLVGNELNQMEKLRQELSTGFLEKTNPFPFKGGAIGYLAYDITEKYEERLCFKNKDTVETENYRFSFYDEYICYDAFTHRISFITNIDKEEKRGYDEILKVQRESFKNIKKRISKNILDIDDDFEKKELIEVEETKKEKFLEMVKKAKKYIEEGDIFQVVLSIRTKVKTEKEDFELYRRLREENPSPYMFLIKYKDFSIIGASPESLVSVKNGVVRTNPIAGTRKRGKTLEEDVKLEKELLNDEKERAEHLMLVDLGRNDIGKISEFSSVNLDQFMKIEKFSHVMHITSRVRGNLKKDKDSFHALESCIPAGTVSGAPKIRAMEIIEELEEVKRGIYSGAVGYFSYSNNVDMSIAIRTIVLKNGIANIQAGAGIVYDSVPEKEYEEIQNKLGILKEVLR
ncbi:MAG: anthranilate synthase component I family protein [Clostridium sp.]|uniref:anthranilate synthase component I family protein n=1 Tax=Clostridium sp. TaxID=1506 RepID=UPI003F2BCF62